MYNDDDDNGVDLDIVGLQEEHETKQRHQKQRQLKKKQAKERYYFEPINSHRDNREDKHASDDDDDEDDDNVNEHTGSNKSARLSGNAKIVATAERMTRYMKL